MTATPQADLLAVLRHHHQLVSVLRDALEADEAYKALNATVDTLFAVNRAKMAMGYLDDAVRSLDAAIKKMEA